MSQIHILVIDDDPDLLFLVAHGIKSLSSTYQVTTAEDGPSALEQMQNRRFDLIVTDYMMPAMTGLEVIEQARQILPEAHYILMTAHHDTAYIRDKIGGLELHGFISKPFTMPDLLAVVAPVLAEQDTASRRIETEPLTLSKDCQEQVQTLHRQTGAHSVLLANSDGKPVYSSGYINRDEALRLAAFVSANFLAIVELATLFGDNQSTFTSSYYQGSKYNIHAYDINGNYFLAVVFGVGGKPGTVWFYTKQAAIALAALLPKTKSKFASQDELNVATDFNNIVQRQS
ncbi:MAG TPA: response regulator [Anaerolineae bacterium]|nr:response regulator [Anaerolineae bacterium]MCB0177847.1 response regulator [Anaerolineae bacterium]MCB0224792.1 response regulator [Anaerolineae bacterium]MCB9103259.1 response regulator [Anaerolineales bacterium]HRV91771.1 response regulator [Anaerolineae bacterium]